MALFNFGKKKEENGVPTCGCKCSCSAETVNQDVNVCCGTEVDGICCIKVLGAGCASCHQQYEYTKEAVANLGLSVEVEYITDMAKVMEYGVMSMPAIVVNDKVVSMGKVLKSSEVEKLLKKIGG